MSLMMCTPASSAFRAVSALYVSIESGTCGNASRTARMTGMTRRISSSAGTGSCPGRVDSPPMSRISAPASTIRTACSTAASTAMYRPPSEKESGVTFRMPITSVRLPNSNVKPSPS